MGNFPVLRVLLLNRVDSSNGDTSPVLECESQETQLDVVGVKNCHSFWTSDWGKGPNIPSSVRYVAFVGIDIGEIQQNWICVNYMGIPAGCISFEMYIEAGIASASDDAIEFTARELDAFGGGQTAMVVYMERNRDRIDAFDLERWARGIGYSAPRSDFIGARGGPNTGE